MNEVNSEASCKSLYLSVTSFVNDLLLYHMSSYSRGGAPKVFADCDHLEHLCQPVRWSPCGVTTGWCDRQSRHLHLRSFTPTLLQYSNWRRWFHNPNSIKHHKFSKFSPAAGSSTSSIFLEILEGFDCARRLTPSNQKSWLWPCDLRTIKHNF